MAESDGIDYDANPECLLLELLLSSSNSGCSDYIPSVLISFIPLEIGFDETFILDLDRDEIRATL